MVYQVERMMRDVRVALDENNRSVSLLTEGDPDTLSQDELIRSKIEDAVRRVHKEAPVHMLESGHHFGDAVYWGDQCSGWVPLPEDFLRLTGFRMSDWERAVYMAISADDPEYAQQRSRFKGIRGTAQRPVCAIVTRPDGLALEFYSCRTEEAYVAQGTYQPEARIDTDGGIDISERCYRAAVYMAASLTANARGEWDRGKALEELSKSELE